MDLHLDDRDIEAIARRVVALMEDGHAAPAREPEPDHWLTTAEAAKHLGITLHALRHLVSRRVIPYSQERPGARQFFRLSDLDRYRESAAREPIAS